MLSPESAEERRHRILDKIVPAVDVRPFIGGTFTAASSSASFRVIDPMTETPLVEMPAAQAEDVAQAVTAARTAFDRGPWPRLAPAERAAHLHRLAALIERDVERLSMIEAIDTGKRLKGVRGWDVPHAAEVYRYYAEWTARLGSDDELAPTGNVRIQTRQEPVGVVAAIVPWNFPFACTAWKLAPALAAGCTVVVKPPERAPLSGQALAALVVEAGFPPGVVNVVNGIGEVAGAALAADPRIDKISFTGDTETARAIAGASARRVPHLTVELGGKSPNVIFADADLDAAVAGTLDAMFDVAGQNCCAGSRTFVQRQVYDEVVGRVVELAGHRRLGDQLDDATEQGPQIDREHVARIHSFVEGAVGRGATCLVGGSPATEVGPTFYRPTIISGAPIDDPISQEEVFGPVATVYPFDDLDEVVALANNTVYGLSASVWTSSTATGEAFAANVRAGTCWVNCFGYFLPYVPWGGVKMSGHGKELGDEGIREFLTTKVVYRAP